MAMDIDLHFDGYNNTVTWNNGQTITPNPVAQIDKWSCVQDHVRGYYQVNNRNFVCVQKTTKYKRIAFIVESPHKDEFDNNFCPLVPMNGKSGIRFSNKICSKLDIWFQQQIQNSQVNNGDCFEVYVMNPVQYQTSLYHFLNGMIPWEQKSNFQYHNIDKTLRNRVWKFLFDTCELKTTFIDRLKEYGPDYIINCCTGGNNNAYGQFNTINQVRRGGTSLKSCVKKEIITAFKNQNIQYLQHKHPISWS